MNGYNRARRSSVAGGAGGGAGLNLAALHPGLASLGGSRPGSPEDSTESGLESVRSIDSGRTMQTGTDKEGKPFRHPQGTYEGATNMNLVPQGFGSYFYRNGDIFRGEWDNGIRDGSGTMTYTTGESYCGEYLLSLAHGQGLYKFLNGDVYEGSFKHGFMHGRGKYMYHTGEVYHGYMRKGSSVNICLAYAYANAYTFCC